MPHIIYQDGLLHRIHNPILPYASGMVQGQFCIVIHRAAARGYDFYHPVWSTLAALVVQFSFITDYGYVRLQIFGIVCK